MRWRRCWVMEAVWATKSSSMPRISSLVVSQTVFLWLIRKPSAAAARLSTWIGVAAAAEASEAPKKSSR